MGQSLTWISETDLIRKIAEKDRLAFSELYCRFSGSVFKWSLRIVRDISEAEEVVQEVFLQIWNKAASYDPGRGELSTWIINITKSRSIDKLRSTRFKKQNVTIKDDYTHNPTTSENVIEEKNENRLIIKSALKKLPKEQKKAIEIVYYGGFTHIEAAEKLKIPVGTIKTRIRLGVSKLRVDLWPYFNEHVLTNI